MLCSEAGLAGGDLLALPRAADRMAKAGLGAGGHPPRVRRERVAVARGRSGGAPGVAAPVAAPPALLLGELDGPIDMPFSYRFSMS